jgi:hypothetical protein
VYVYAMGQEPWLNYIMSIKYTDQSRPIIESNRLLKVCHERGIISERLFGEKEILLTAAKTHDAATVSPVNGVAGNGIAADLQTDAAITP